MIIEVTYARERQLYDVAHGLPISRKDALNTHPPRVADHNTAVAQQGGTGQQGGGGQGSVGQQGSKQSGGQLTVSIVSGIGT
jgi:hypothetical protein